MKNKEELDLLVFGDTALDHFYQVDKLPKVNSAAEVLEGKRFYGGMGANTTVIAKSLGLKTGLVSVIGTDAEEYRRYLENWGIKLDLKGIFGETTRSLFFKENGREFSFFYPGVMKKMNELEFTPGWIKASSCVYMARTYLDLQKRVSKKCKNKFLVYNPGYGVFNFEKIPKKFYQILKKTDVLVLNHHELRYLKKMGFEMDFKLGPDNFLITKGSEGCRIYSKKAQTDVPTYQAELADASGAGDAFNAGFIAAYLKDYNIYDSVKIGNATASFVVEKWGCQTNLPCWGDVLERAKEI